VHCEGRTSTVFNEIMKCNVDVKRTISTVLLTALKGVDVMRASNGVQRDIYDVAA
jgi:hypothetical protein